MSIENELTERQKKVLEYVENYEQFFSYNTGGVWRNPKPIPLNTVRSREGLPQITVEEILEQRKKTIDNFNKGNVRKPT